MPLEAVVVGVNVALLPAVVVLKLLGPVQLYDTTEPVPVTAPAVNVKELPTHRLVDDGVMLATVGNAFTVTAGEVTAAVLVQPVPV